LHNIQRTAQKGKKRRSHVFQSIAPIYGLFYSYQTKYYTKVLEKVKNEINLSAYTNIIDIGCGTGALCAVLNQKGLRVTGVDLVQKMLDIAGKKQGNTEVEFIQANVLKKIPFEDKSFDLSISSYVAHGLNAEERRAMYEEMSRVTKYWVIIHDYNEKKRPLTSILESLEGGDYFNFMKKARLEMKEYFLYPREIDCGSWAVWYIGRPKA
jgi:ubiquinone/menaquinone biosynthesis C-methylase UbiE